MTFFKEFYSQLYTSESSNNEAHMSEFFTALDVPAISEDNRQMLDSPLQLNEVTEAIKLMNNNKSPGPNGFPVEFFKTFIEKLAPLLLRMFTQSLQQGCLPPTLTQASISLILKDKDPLNCVFPSNIVTVC